MHEGWDKGRLQPFLSETAWAKDNPVHVYVWAGGGCEGNRAGVHVQQEVVVTWTSHTPLS